MKAALFDFDGTLVDSMPTWGRKVLRILELSGITPPEGILRILTPLGDTGSMKYFKEHFGVTMTEEEMLREMDAFAVPKYAHEILLKEGAREYLEALRANGVRIFLLTASPRQCFVPCLENVGVASLFEEAWSCEDFKTVKSNPDIYRMAAERMGVRVGDITFFDDNIIALKTAKEAGLRTVGVFDESSAADEAAIRAFTDEYVYALNEASI